MLRTERKAVDAAAQAGSRRCTSFVNAISGVFYGHLSVTIFFHFKMVKRII
jgi:hypothetical protein